MAWWEPVVAPVLKIIDKVIPDKAAAQVAKDQLTAQISAGELQEELAELKAVTSDQSDVNKVEAASSSLFVAGWRPFVGWVCGTALAISVVVAPLATWFAMLAGKTIVFPIVTNPLLQSTLVGMLGLGHVSRTYEKVKGIAGNH